ncbi:MAG: chorismate synthase [Bacteroidales bacterium]|nr:chorismate synthase [Bacteroidales bacterium]
MNTFGHIFKIQIFGESHGDAVGVVIDGCPPGISINEDDFKQDLLRRKSGAKGTTSRKEDDKPQIISGIHNSYSTGAPITILFKNSDTHSLDYNFRQHPRPGHADFVADKKYKSFNDDIGGGHFSGRLTVGLVAAGVIAKKIISDINIVAKLTEAGGNINIADAVDKALKTGDSIGGIIECSVTNVPFGLGEPFFDSVESLISHAVFSIPGVKAIEFGNGFEAAKMKGSEHNDLIINETGTTKTNNAGGINGGISNGNDIFFKIAVKPTSSISLPQETFNFESGKPEKLEIKGRHDACIALRIPVITEAVTACVLADLMMIDNTQKI